MGLVRGQYVSNNRRMDFDDQLRRYFGTTDLPSIAPAALEAGIGNGESYLNVHTALPLGFPGGEIRGFLVAPEPGTLLLLVAGLAGLSGVTWRRHCRK